MTRPKKPDDRQLAPVIPLAPRMARRDAAVVSASSSELEGVELWERIGDGYTVLTVRGEIDILTVPSLDEWLAGIVRTQLIDLLVDLNGTSFIDSTGLHVLLNTQRRLMQDGRRLYVVCAGGPVLRAIEFARLSATFRLISSEREYPGRAAH
jgi:anti-sigma B factor antagonist